MNELTEKGLPRGPLPHGHGSVTFCMLSRARGQAVSDFFIKLMNAYSCMS
jgi:hypothetical protein